MPAKNFVGVAAGEKIDWAGGGIHRHVQLAVLHPVGDQRAHVGQASRKGFEHLVESLDAAFRPPR